jgi:hypothetical protein
MSKGISKLQRGILDLLQGKSQGQVYTSGTELTTSELLDEMQVRELVKTQNRKEALFTIRRACDSLCRRGLIKGTYTRDCDRWGCITVAWDALPPPAA